MGNVVAGKTTAEHCAPAGDSDRSPPRPCRSIGRTIRPESSEGIPGTEHEAIDRDHRNVRPHHCRQHKAEADHLSWPGLARHRLGEPDDHGNRAATFAWAQPDLPTRQPDRA